MHGQLIVFEGPDGFGKSTLCSLFASSLRKSGIVVEQLSFPGKTDGSLGKIVYEIHHNPTTHKINDIDPAALQLLHLAAHVDNVKRQVKPLLKSGTTVVLDRFWWSLLVYGKVSGVDLDILKYAVQIERLIFKDLTPTCIFLIIENKFLVQEDENTFKRTMDLLEEYKKLANEEQGSKIISLMNNDAPKKVVSRAIKSLSNMRRGTS